ncbi:MAG TPA: carboxypeptidase regulatory-like domain-containing protein [Edaphobacter sp.]|nr:carboxypeptidase regulatory-like domain-containing protein [Edaphobacter sp.]
MIHPIALKLRRLAAAVSLLLLALTLIPTACAQEVTGGIEGVVKDPTGATVDKAAVILTGAKQIGVKSIVTDASGYYHFSNIDPGLYSITVRAPGFSELKRDGIEIQVGRLPSINLTLSVGSEKTVVEVSTETPQIDVTQSRTQTTISKDQIDFAPRGRSFESVLAFAPGARNEPLQGGFQVDGAATAENSYLIEGQETGSLVTGKATTSAPFEFIQEVQLKTSGIDAENGGAMGGVVNAIQKKGSNAWHGSVFAYYQADPFDARGAATNSFGALTNSLANPSNTLRYDPNSSYSTAGRSDFAAQFYSPAKDHYRQVQPGFEAGGYLIKDRLWLFGSGAPQFNTKRRTMNFTTAKCVLAGNCLGLRTFNFSEQIYFSLVRLDLKVTDKIRVFAAYQYNYDRQSGTAFPNADSVDHLLNASAGTPVDSFNGGIGNIAPNNLFTTGADIVLSSNIVATTRFGHAYQNYADRGLPNGDRYLLLVNTPTVAQAGSVAKATQALDGTLLESSTAGYPAISGQSANYSNIAANLGYGYQINTRTTFNQDVAYFKKGFFGTHNFKFGYQLNHLYENVNQTFTNDLVRLSYGVGNTYGPGTTLGASNCAAIAAANATHNWTNGSGGGAGGCQGLWGYVNIRDGNEVTGTASSNNHSFYGQDSWQVAKGFTANIGLRVEKEYLPSYNQFPSGISFGFGDKISPRLGGAWDVFQNGKMKVFGSYGFFYDLMHLNLAIGSFGGNYWHDCVYALDVADYSNIHPQKNAAGHYCPTGGAAVGANFAGGSTPAGLRFIENQDFRIPSNDPSQGAAVDPNIKPYREHQAVGGIDYQINRTLAFESRYDRVRLDHAIEDVGYIGPNGEAFIIANPGFGTDAGGATPTCPTCKLQPKAARNYDAVEFRLTKAMSSHWFGQVAYTYSKLRGNYSGLTSTDVADGGGARANPNNNRAFDEPQFQFDAAGNVANGLLATDRPNSFKAVGYYKYTAFKRHDLSASIFQQASSGSPLSSYADVNGAAGSYPVYVVGRGNWIDVTKDATGTWIYGKTYVRRTPWFIQSDASLTESYAVSPAHETWRLGFEANFTNLFNQKAATVYNQHINSSGGSTGNYILPPGSTAGNPNYGILENGYDWKAIANSSAAGTRGPLVLNNLYGLPNQWQAGRQIRLKFKFVF